ncbi:hypothetical protein [Novipirellula caenicola]|uniref:Uncharacterized protein n=1 Tax=Novipirellula caenicola TaxID=1536901 RepID=A0ABP9VLY1_9BACT
MNRWLLIGSLAGLLLSTTGCLHHNVRSGSHGCGNPNCNSGHCSSTKGTGLLGRIGAKHSGCQSCGGNCGGRTGCVAGPLGWQQGGLDYSSHLQPGLFGHGAGAQIQAQPVNPGPPTGQVGYPYYSHHGPRDFFLDNPPTIGR